jgi:DNA-binding NarL/FixJ family response regulator
MSILTAERRITFSPPGRPVNSLVSWCAKWRNPSKITELTAARWILFLRGKMGAGHFIVVESDSGTQETLLAVCRAFRSAEGARDLGRAHAIFSAQRQIIGLITELDLPDGNGVELVKSVRRHRPLLPILVLTSRTDPNTINALHGLRTEFLCKPTRRRALKGFLRRAVAFERLKDVRVAELIDIYARRHRLTPRETDLVIGAVAGMSRDALGNQLGTSQNTLKTQVRSLLRKCGLTSLDELARLVLSEMLVIDAHPDSNPYPSDSPPSAGPPTIQPHDRLDKPPA